MKNALTVLIVFCVASMGTMELSGIEPTSTFAPTIPFVPLIPTPVITGTPIPFAPVVQVTYLPYMVLQ